jgi:translation initiation factor 2 beta subunit (eIF-2beta)/eIF-5
LLDVEGHVNYEYNDMYERIRKLLSDKNPQLAEGNKLKKDEEPYVVKMSTKTAWQNFDSMVTAIDRKHDHVMSFIATELGAEATLGQENNLIL